MLLSSMRVSAGHWQSVLNQSKIYIDFFQAYHESFQEMDCEARRLCFSCASYNPKKQVLFQPSLVDNCCSKHCSNATADGRAKTTDLICTLSAMTSLRVESWNISRLQGSWTREKAFPIAHQKFMQRSTILEWASIELLCLLVQQVPFYTSMPYTTCWAMA